MRFFTDAMEARLHQELYVAMLDSLLSERGSIQALAKRANVSTVYLSNIRNLDLLPPRIPLPKTAKKIADGLAAPPEIRDTAHQHMVLAHERRVQTQHFVKAEFLDRSLPDLAAELGDHHHRATFAETPALAHRHYLALAETVAQALREFSAEEDPLAFVRLCLIRHDVSSTLDRAYEALWYAKRARFTMEHLDPARYRPSRDLAEYLTINALYAEAISYDNLGLYRDALTYYAQAGDTEASQQQLSYWKHAIIRGKIKALSQIPRFSITEVENLADEGKEACHATSAEIAPLFELLIAEALIVAYVRHANYREAERIMHDCLERLDKVPMIGPIHRTTILQACARLRWAMQDRLGCRYFLTEAKDIAADAGLEGKRNQIEQELQGYTRTKGLSEGDAISL